MIDMRYEMLDMRLGSVAGTKIVVVTNIRFQDQTSFIIS